MFVALPMDVLDAELDEEVVPTSIPDTRVAPSAEAVRAAVAMLAGASRPIVITGDGIAFSGAQAELTRVAELLGAEVWGANFSEVNIAADASALPRPARAHVRRPQPGDHLARPTRC